MRHNFAGLLLLSVVACSGIKMGAPEGATQSKFPLAASQLHSLRSVASDGKRWVAVGGGGTATGAKGEVARQVSLWTREKELNAVAYGQGRWVAVGREALISSANGLIWESTDAIVKDKNLLDVRFASGRWVAVGETILTSAEGTNWHPSATEHGPKLLYCVAEHGGRWVAAGHDGTIQTSTDGSNWQPSEQSEQWGGTISDIAVHKGRWVMVGSSGLILASDNGATWRRIGEGITDEWLRSIATDGKNWVAVGREVIVHSRDGEHWNVVHKNETDPVNEYLRNRDLNSVIYNDHRWIAVGSKGAVLVSVDGIKWELAESGSNSDLEGVIFTDGIWLAVTSHATLVASNDSANWNVISIGVAGSWLNRVVNAGGHWVAVGFGPHLGAEIGVIGISENGEVWERVGGSVTKEVLTDVVFDGRQWIVVGAEGFIGASEDLRNWRQVTHAATKQNLNAVWHSGGSWVAIGDGGAILFSPDGREWIDAEVHGFNRLGSKLLKVTRQDSRWMIVGERGIMLTSLDGRNWQRVGEAVAERNSLAGLGYGKGRWIVTGYDGLILTSVNGIDWTQAGKGLTSDSLGDAVFDGNRWVIAGTSNGILTSTDGVGWQVVPALSGQGPSGPILFSEGGWISEGRGRIVTSTNGIDWADVAGRADGFDLKSFAYHDGSWVAVGQGPLHLIEPRISVPLVTEIRFAFSPTGHDSATVSLSESASACEPAARLLMRAQNAHNYESEALDLKAIGIQDGMEIRDARVQLDFSLARELGVRRSEPFYYSARVTCGAYATVFPAQLRAARVMYDPWWNRPPLWLILTAASWSALLMGTVALYVTSPLSLLRVHRAASALGPIGAWQVPFTGVKLSDLLQAWNLFLLPWLCQRPRTLDAWIARHAEKWLERGFEQDPTVRRSTGFVPLPCRFAEPQTGELLKEPTADLMSRLWAQSTPWVEIVGGGGAGKTMLAVQLCRWASQRQSDSQSTRVRRLPVLVDDETGDLVSVLRRKLRASLNDEIEEDLVRALLRSGRLLVVFDRLSERTGEAVSAVRSLQGRTPAGAVLVTTRREFEYEGQGVTRLYPVPLGPDSAMLLMATLLVSKGDVFPSMQQQVELAQRLTQLITIRDTELPLTPLIVRLFVDRAVEIRTKGVDVTAVLPRTLPEAYAESLRIINPTDAAAPHYLSHEEMLRVARLLAVQAVGDVFVPQPFPKDEARDNLRAIGWTAADPRDPIERLLLNGVLIERSRGARFDLEFALDPVAEYLAADELLYQCGRDSHQIDVLFQQVRARGEVANGFLQALEVTREVSTIA